MNIENGTLLSNLHLIQAAMLRNLPAFSFFRILVVVKGSSNKTSIQFMAVVFQLCQYR